MIFVFWEVLLSCCLYLKSDIFSCSDLSVKPFSRSTLTWATNTCFSCCGGCIFFSYCPTPWRKEREKKAEGQSSFYLQKTCEVGISSVWHVLEQNLLPSLLPPVFPSTVNLAKWRMWILYMRSKLSVPLQCVW